MCKAAHLCPTLGGRTLRQALHGASRQAAGSSVQARMGLCSLFFCHAQKLSPPQQSTRHGSSREGFGTFGQCHAIGNRCSPNRAERRQTLPCARSGTQRSGERRPCCPKLQLRHSAVPHSPKAVLRKGCTTRAARLSGTTGTNFFLCAGVTLSSVRPLGRLSEQAKAS